jgi:threonine dehydrogenase-like Zn-dependent dehydrogenase
MIAAGTLDLSRIQPHIFPLDQVNEAIAEASRLKGFDFCMVDP